MKIVNGKTICSFSVIYPLMEIINLFVIIGNVGILKFFDVVTFRNSDFYIINDKTFRVPF